MTEGGCGGEGGDLGMLECPLHLFFQIMDSILTADAHTTNDPMLCRIISHDATPVSFFFSGSTKEVSSGTITHSKHHRLSLFTLDQEPASQQPRPVEVAVLLHCVSSDFRSIGIVAMGE